jgi:hypothetical protein
MNDQPWLLTAPVAELATITLELLMISQTAPFAGVAAVPFGAISSETAPTGIEYTGVEALDAT